MLKRKSRPRKKRAKRTPTKEQILGRKLRRTIFAILFLVVALFLSIKYAPKVASLFGILSIHKDQEDQLPKIIPPPFFVDVPEATSSEKIDIEGVAEPTTTVKLYVNGPEKASTVADQEGKFLFTKVELIKGINTLFAKAVGENSKESTNSEIIKVTVDDDRPKITITEPKNGETIKNLNKRVLVEGSSDEALSEVKINGRTAVMKGDNKFELLLGVEEGGVEIKVEATDLAGNTRVESIFIKYEKRGG